MARKPTMKWREQDIDRLNKDVKNFNAKLKRITAKDPTAAAYLPEKMSVRTIKKEISTRNEFNRQAKALERFSRKGAETRTTVGEIPLTKWERKNISVTLGVLNKQRKADRAKFGEMPVTAGGVKTGYKRAEIPSLRMAEFKPKLLHPGSLKNREDLRRFAQSAARQASERFRMSKMTQYVENYIKGLTKVFGSRADSVSLKIKSLDPELVVNMLYANQEASIDYIYDPMSMDAKLEEITDLWENMEDWEDEA